MAHIAINGLWKKYNKVTALSDITLDIKDKEFLVIFGPAGAGKTTLLSAIAGILSIDSGTISFNNVNINGLEPSKRNVAMVFENYALYPHMTVYDNIAFPLRSPEFKKDEEYIKKSIEDITKKMNIFDFLDRFPSQLSNGQRQRVALGRALVRDPNVFLMDEPLAHLDAKLKNLMRTELKEIQNQLNTTSIYVTHDYLEALSLADRVVVINEGKIVQVATPSDIYYRPVNVLVSRLIGEPEINIFEGNIKKDAIQIIKTNDVSIPIHAHIHKKLKQYCEDDSVLVGWRGTDVKTSLSYREGYLVGKVVDSYSIGNRFVIEFHYQGISIRTLIESEQAISIDSDIFFMLDESQVLFFHSHTQEFICRNEDRERK